MSSDIVDTEQSGTPIKPKIRPERLAAGNPFS